MILGESEVTVMWDVPDTALPGSYRLGHRGYWHTIIRGNIYYEGWSQPFTVTNPARTQQAFLGDVDTALHSQNPAVANSGNSLQSPLSLLSQWL